MTVQEATHGCPPTIRSQRSSIGTTRPSSIDRCGWSCMQSQALDDGLLDLLDPVGRAPGVGVDAEDRVVVDLGLEALRPAAIAAKPGGPLISGSTFTI